MLGCLGKKKKKNKNKNAISIGQLGNTLSKSQTSLANGGKTNVRWNTIDESHDRKNGGKRAGDENSLNGQNSPRVTLPSDCLRMTCRYIFQKLTESEIHIPEAFTDVYVSDWEYRNQSHEFIHAYSCNDIQNHGLIFRNYLAECGTPQALKGFCLIEKSVLLQIIPEDHFCVRMPSANQKSETQPFSITYNSKKYGRVTNYQVFLTPQKQFSFKGSYFDSLPSIIEFIQDHDCLIPFNNPPPMNKPREIDEGNLEILRELGSGNFGVVHEARMKQAGNHSSNLNDAEGNGMLVAVKTLRIKPGFSREQEEQERDKFIKEMNIHNFVFASNSSKSSSCVELLAVCHGEPQMMVLEHCSGGSAKDLYEKLKRKKEPLDKKVGFNLIISVMNAVQQLSEINIVHRDIAARNILISTDSRGVMIFKLSDFGLARIIPDESMSKDQLANLPVYSPENRDPLPLKWTSPEQLSSRATLGTKSNIYMAVVTIFEIYTFASPWATLEKSVVKQRLLDYENYFEEHQKVSYEPLPREEAMDPKLLSILLPGIYPVAQRAQAQHILMKLSQYSVDPNAAPGYSMQVPT